MTHTPSGTPPTEIRSVDDAATRVEQLRAEGHRTILVFADFNFAGVEILDRLHALRREGDALIIGVTSTPNGHPSPELPVLPLRLRAETAAATPGVDLVIELPPGMAEPDAVAKIQPDICLGDVDSPAWWPHRSTDAPAASNGNGPDHDTSSRFGQAAIEPMNTEAQAYLSEFRQQHTADGIIEKLRGLSDLRVLVIGDAIIDEYHFCRPYGMPMKAPIIAAQFEKAEQYAGGALAVANHVANFCRDVQLVTCLGQHDTKDAFIRSKLLSNVACRAFYRPDAPTTIKRRYLRKFLMYRLFELSFYNDTPIDPPVADAVCEYLEEALPGYDLVLAVDFGHGFITPQIIDVLQKRSRFLAVNTQANSINRGYHVITRYPHADFVCLDEDEARFACRSQFAPLEELIVQLAKRLQCGMITVTRGHHGSLTYDLGRDQFSRVPVLSRGVVDTLGAGDAYLSFAAPCVARGFAPDLNAFIANCAGAIAVQIVGNKRPVGADVLYEYIREMLA